MSRPRPSTIYGAAKLTGALGHDLHVGVVSALIARNDVHVSSDTLPPQNRLAEPLTLVDIARLRWEVGNNGYLGILATATNQFEPADAYPVVSADDATMRRLCPGGAQVAPGARCFHDAYVAAADGHWRSPSGAYMVSGRAIVTAIDDGLARTLRDGTRIESGDVAGPPKAPRCTSPTKPASTPTTTPGPPERRSGRHPSSRPPPSAPGPT